MTELDQIRAFLEAMRERHSEQIDNIELPEGTYEYMQSLVDAGDTESLMFVLKLSYLMGLQTGFAVAGESPGSSGTPTGDSGSGPIKA